MEKGALDLYATPAVRTLVTAIASLLGHPIAGVALDNVLMHRREQLGKERLEIFGEAFLMTGRISVDEMNRRIREDDRFCTVVIRVVEAASKTEREEKVRMFARMLSNYDYIVVGNTAEDFEEMQRTLDDMSYREWQLLLVLRKLEEQTDRIKGEPVIIVDWEEFARCAREKGVVLGEEKAFMERLARTGCVESITFTGVGAGGRRGWHTTPYLNRLIMAVGGEE